MAQKMSQQKHSELKDLRSQHGTANWNWGGGQIHSRITLGDAFAETFRGVFDIFKEFSCPSWHKVFFKQRYCSVHAHDDFFDGRKRMESLCWLNTLIHGKSCEIFGWTNWDQGEPVLWKVNWSGDRALSSPWGTAQLSRLWAASPLLIPCQLRALLCLSHSPDWDLSLQTETAENGTDERQRAILYFYGILSKCIPWYWCIFTTWEQKTLHRVL